MIERIEDVLKFSVVLAGIRLLQAEEEVESFRRIIGSDVIEEGPGASAFLTIPGVPGSPRPLLPQKLHLPKERVQLELQPDRSAIHKDYPTAEDIGRFSEIVRYTIERSNREGQDLKAFGFNLEAVYTLSEGKTAFDFLSTRAYHPGLLEGTGFTLIGGTPKLVMVKDDNLWSLTLDARFGDLQSDRVYANWNLHFDDTSLPSPHRVREELRRVWRETHLFVTGEN